MSGHHEIDILLPEHNIGIEFNGIYWHSFSRRGDKYHLRKTKECAINAIQLLHIFDYQWYLKQDIVKSLISSKLGFTNRIFARKCKIEIIDNKTKNEFLDQTHLQGRCNSSVDLGLFYNNELVSVMTFSKSRFDTSYEYELVRFSSKLNNTIVGGFSKLLTYFIRTYKPNNIMSYVDRTISTGNAYIKNGFKLVDVTKPNYFYFKDMNVYSRQQFQKNKLKNKLPIFDNTLTEYQNMQINKYDKCYDCGNYKFVMVM